jgi:chromosome segregation ATPase
MKTTRIVIGLIVISFLAGLFGGYSIWKPKENGKVDIPELLAKVGEATGRIEKRNQDLLSQVEALKGNAREAESLKAANLALRGQLDNSVGTLQGRIAGLDNEVRTVNARLKQKQQEIAEKGTLIDRLQAELSAARQGALQVEKFKALSDDLQSRISALEKENSALKSVIDNISEITKRKDAHP